MIGVIDYGICNVGSVVNMLRRIGVASSTICSPEELDDFERIILPGVGHFATAMKNLQANGMDTEIRRQVLEKQKPLLGICLGMQLLAKSSEEGDCKGLGLVPGRVVRFRTNEMSPPMPVPNMGWSEVKVVAKNPITDALLPNSRFYFVHSYHFETDSADLPMLTAHHGYEFVAGFAMGKILGVQFHPEKSHRFGAQLLQAFSQASYV